MSAPTAPAEEPAAHTEPPEPHEPWWQRLIAGSSAWIGFILVALIAVFAILSFEEFFAISNGRNIATDAAVLLVLAVGLTFIIVLARVRLKRLARALR